MIYFGRKESYFLIIPFNNGTFLLKEKRIVMNLANFFPLKNICVKSIALLIGIVYLFLVCTLQSLVTNKTITLPFLLFLFLFCNLTIFISVKILSAFVNNYNIKVSITQNKPARWVWGISSVIIFLFFLLYFTGQYPGGMSPDTISQYAQAIGMEHYNDWHPVLHTLLFFTLPLLTGHHLGLIVFLQIVYFSIAFGYLSYVMYRNGCSVLFLTIAIIYTCVNPFMASYMMYPWKDIAFTIFSILLFAYYIQIICSKGTWLSQSKNCLAFSATVILCATMRHNAILFVFPLTVIALCHTKRKTLYTVILSLLLFIGSFGMIHLMLHVDNPDSRITETSGLPITVWCNVMKNNPNALPTETREVLYTLADQETYESEYVTGDFNSIKWSENFNTSAINNMSYKDILKYTAQCFIYAPKESLQAVATLTELVWGINGSDSPVEVTVTSNPFGISQSSFPVVHDLVSQMKSFFCIGIGKTLFGSHGLKLLILLLLSCVLAINRKISFIHIIPLICYNFGTMLLLSGRDYRFFLFNIPLLFPYIFLMLKEQREFKTLSKFRKVSGLLDPAQTE